MKDLRQHHRVGINSGDDLQLGQRLCPISENAMKLKEEDSELGIFRMSADLVLKFEQRFVRLPRREVFFGGHPFERGLNLIRQDAKAVSAPKARKIRADRRLGWRSR